MFFLPVCRFYVLYISIKFQLKIKDSTYYTTNLPNLRPYGLVGVMTALNVQSVWFKPFWGHCNLKFIKKIEQLNTEMSKIAES